MTLLLTNQDVQQVLTMDTLSRCFGGCVSRIGTRESDQPTRSHTYCSTMTRMIFISFKSVEGGVLKSEHLRDSDEFGSRS